MGVATTIPVSSEGADALLKEADNALYHGKHTGRNSVHSAADIAADG
ncbi:hypothetical protein [Candidatus Reidiella endopervernicosa]|nr:hypothetical protein [Candidatus Reidiella endopervernicosa]